MKSVALLVVALCSAAAIAGDPPVKSGTNVSWTFDQRLSDLEKRLAVVENNLGLQQAPSPRVKAAACDCASTGVCTCGNGCVCPKPAITSVLATLPPEVKAVKSTTTLTTDSGRTIELGADGLYRYVGDAPVTTTTATCVPGTTCAPAQSFQQFGGVPIFQPVQNFQQFQPVQNFQQFQPVQNFQQFQPRFVGSSCANGRCGR